MTWKRRTPAANRRRRHRVELATRFYESICASISDALQELQLMYASDPEAYAAAAANLIELAEAEATR